jgi:TatD DNase family protein
MLIDVHCHLEMCEKPDDIASEAEKKDIIIVTAGVGMEANKKALEFASKHKNVQACLGMYPVDALKLTDKEINNIVKQIKENKDKVWGIGEIGLDYKESEKDEERERQREIFEKFIKLAIELDKPTVVHSRKAEEDCIKILEELKAKRVIMHCFSGKMSFVKKIIENGWMLSIPTSVNNSEHFQGIIKITPITQLLCETDAPYLHPRKEWPNSSLNIAVCYAKIAEIKQLDVKEVERQIEKNFEILYSKA